MSSITPLIRTFQKGSFVTFQSAEEDMEFMFNDSGKKTKFSHFVLLNIPAIQTPTDNNNNIQFRNIEGNFTQGLSTATPYPQGDRIDFSQNFQNYVLNMESLITSSKDYNRINSRTVSERIFFKWLKEIGAIRFKESTASEYKFFGVTERRYVEESDNQDNSIDLYTKVIKYIGGLDIQGSNLISNKNSTKEAYSYIPSQNGCTPIVLLKTIADENYYPGQVIKKETNVNIEYISGRDSSDQPTPANLDVFAIYDMDVPLSSFNYSVNGGVDPIWFEYLASYGPNCYFTDEVFDDPSNDSIVRTQVTPPDSVTYLRSKLDGISIDFDVANYTDIADSNGALETFNDYNNVPKSASFDFNAILLYYEVYDPNNPSNSTRPGF